MTLTMRRLLWPGLPCASAALLAVWMVRPLTSMEPPPAPLAAVSVADPGAFLQRWCYDCHGDGAAKGDLSMDGPSPLLPGQWENIRRHVVLRTMPPEGEAAPSAADRLQFESDLLTWQAGQGEQDIPPRVRRLNRRELANSLRGLLGTGPDPESLPEEESAHGFDNNAGLQPLPPPVLDRYASVIRETLRLALLPPPVPRTIRRFMPQEFSGSGGPSPEAEGFYETETSDLHRIPILLPTAGEYLFRLTAYGHAAGTGSVQVRLMDSAPQPLLSLDRLTPQTLTIVVSLPAGPSHLTFQLANPLRDPRHPNPHRRVRRLLVHEASLDGPLEGDATPSVNFVRVAGPVPPADAPWDSRLQAAAASLANFARRAWRRPVSLQESTRLTLLAGQAMAHGLRYDQALTMTAEAILTSPHFLFLTDPAAENAVNRPYAVAARLAYTLWSTLPDEAQPPGLIPEWTPDQLRNRATAMLDDPRAAALARDFAGQWLQLRNTGLARPDPGLFPEVTPARLASWQESAGHFFLHLVRENRPVLELLNAAYAFEATPTGAALERLTSRAAAVAGTSPSGLTDLFRPVALDNPDQFGLLGHPAVLILTSYPNRTSPVLRGKYVLEALLGLQPPPPPPDVPTLQPAAALPGQTSLSIRGALESHRADPSCASCHRAIDPLGFPLEAFDAVGRPRAMVMPEELRSLTFSGETLHRPSDLRAWLSGPQGLRVVHHTAERFLTYALGRGLAPAEILTAHRIADHAGGREARFRDLLLALLSTPAFLGEPASGKTSP